MILLIILTLAIITGICYLVMVINQKLRTNYQLTNSLRSEASKTKICIIGCGVSGICAGHFLLGLSNFISFSIVSS